MENRVKIAVSACLLGKNVRYDGGNKHDSYITGALADIFTLVPICPEAEAGMGTPREPMHLAGEPDSPLLLTNSSLTDKTGQMLEYCTARLDELERSGIRGLILKARSPSCGISGVMVLAENGLEEQTGSGLFAKAVRERFPNIPVIDEENLADPHLREEFILKTAVGGALKKRLDRNSS